MRIMLALPATLLASLALAAPAPWHVFEGTQSPNGRFAMAWGVPKMRTESPPDGIAVTNARGVDVGEKVKNYLFDVTRNRPVRVLPGTVYYPRQNNNRLSVKWAADSSVAYVQYDGEWEPIALSLVTPTGKPLSILDATVTSARQYLESHFGSDAAYQAAKPNLAISVGGAQVFGNELALTLRVTDGKVGNYRKPLFLRHRFDVASTGAIRLTHTSVAEDPR